MYGRFGLMIAISTAAMYGVMYLNTLHLGHAYFSETRLYMAVLMAAVMTLVMLAFMSHMLRSRAANVAIALAAATAFAGSLWLVRSQATIGDVAWMRAMVPHHSIAILTSERAELTDPKVRRLAAEIVESQRREIAQMRALIRELE